MTSPRTDYRAKLKIFAEFLGDILAVCALFFTAYCAFFIAGALQ